MFINVYLVIKSPLSTNGYLVSDVDGQMAGWAEYFEQLFKINPPCGQLHITGLQVMDADLHINEADEVKEAVAKLRVGKTLAFVSSVRSCSKLEARP